MSLSGKGSGSKKTLAMKRKSAEKRRKKAEKELKALEASTTNSAYTTALKKKGKSYIIRKSKTITSCSGGASPGAKCHAVVMQYSNGTNVIINVEKSPRKKRRKGNQAS